MRIKSKFKDYYDTGMQHGFDPGLTFIRETREELENSSFYCYNTDCCYLIVCGKVFPIISLGHTTTGLVYVYSFEDYLKNKSKYYSSVNDDEAKHHFKRNSITIPEKYRNKPIILIERIGYDNKITYNPILRKLEFFKVMDPYTLYQELTMFLGNIASPEKPIPTVSDKDLIVGKGFDLKYSFRKGKQKK